MTIKTIFLDRDGVVNIDKNYLFKINDFEFNKGIFKACLHFQNIGFKIIIITNQSGIARGLYSKNDFLILTKWMLLEFEKNNIEILDVLYCPHGPKSNCKCRKPKPGMFIEAKNTHKIEMEKSWMIGDKESDIEAANLAGINQTILVKSDHKIDKSNAMYFVDSIYQANQIITN